MQLLKKENNLVHRCNKLNRTSFFGMTKQFIILGIQRSVTGFRGLCCKLRGVPTFLRLLLVISSGSFFCGFRGSMEIYVLAGILGVFFFAVSFFSMAAGLSIVAVAMLFSPEFILGALGERAIAIRLEDLLIPILVLAWLANVSTRKNARLIGRSPINKPVIYLLLLSAVSSAWGVVCGTVDLLPAFFYQGKVLEYFILFYLVLNFIQFEKQIKVFLFFAMMTVLFLAVFTLLQVPHTEMFTENRISTPFESNPQPSTAGGYLAFSFFLVFSLMMYQKSTGKKMILAVLALMVLVPLIFTYSRTTYMMLVGGMIVLAVLSKIRLFRFLLVITLLASPVILPATVKERIAFTWEDGKNPGRDLGVDASTQGRLYSVRRMWYSVTKNPILGLGIASWEYPDNQYVRTVYEIGFVGLFLWLMIYIRLFKMGQWLYDTCPSGTFKGLALGYSAGVIGMLLHGLGSCTFYVVRIMEPFWFISGLVAALYNFKLNEFYAASDPNKVVEHE